MVEPWRTYISEIKLKEVNGTKKKPILLLLLNDHVVFATGKKKNKYKGKLELIECWVADISNTEGFLYFSLFSFRFPFFLLLTYLLTLIYHRKRKFICSISPVIAIYVLLRFSRPENTLGRINRFHN